ncbi:MAG: Putative transmembrane lipoprotein [Candidatus Burkholderia crenata]|nr:MAG: Putative transmembrane lipoprotein [Candidatus Burkholderia crenata]
MATAASAACSATAFADTLDERNELVNHFVTDFNANPLVADCAAHGSFVASTSTAFDHVEFPASSFDSAHGSIVPWNDAFDDRKQRTKVDNVVTVEGLGITKDGDSSPTTLKFRCGYVGSQMLAFGWNDPVPSARPRAEPRSGQGVKGRHGAVKGKGKTSSKSKSAGDKTTKKSASKKKH